MLAESNIIVSIHALSGCVPTKFDLIFYRVTIACTVFLASHLSLRSVENSSVSVWTVARSNKIHCQMFNSRLIYSIVLSVKA
jgi:hypothetical protein